MQITFFSNFINKIKSRLGTLSDNQKKAAIASACTIIVVLSILIVLLANKNKSAVHLECFEQKGSSSLFALNSHAQKGKLSSAQTAYFKFTQVQKDFLSIINDKFSTASLTVRIQLIPTKDKQITATDTLSFGFLTNEDFSQKGKFLNQISKSSHPLIQAKLQNAPQTFDISFALSKSSFTPSAINKQTSIPQGFFITSDYDCKIVASCIVPSEIGFDVSSSIPFYGFACTGGVLDFSNKSFDFSGASMVFPVENSLQGTKPEFVITLSQNPQNKSTFENSVKITFVLGGEKYNVKNVNTTSPIILPSSAAKSPFSRMELTQNESEISSFILRSTHYLPDENNQVLLPIRTDPGLMLNYSKEFWRTLDYEVFEWDRFPGILFFDTRNYEVQDNFFRRMAYFVEKEGFKGTLLTNEELQGRHGYNAHDYSSTSMAAFFNKAQELNFPLNKEEELLKDILLTNNLLEYDGEKFIAHEGGIVSISRESAPWLRATLLSHEGWHTLFFKDEEFRNFVAAVYYTMDQTSVDFIKDFFKSQPSLGYDTNDDYLMHNEFMAYLMQQKLSETASYFVHLANRGSVIKYTPKLAAYVRQTEGRTFEDAAFALNDFVFDKYQITGGNISLIEKQ